MNSLDSKVPNTIDILYEASTPTRSHEQSNLSLFNSKPYYLETTGHGNNALSNMYKMKQHEQLCDVTLKVGLEIFKVHRVVLASISPYFFAMFNSKMKEQFSSEIVLHDIDAAAIELLLDYGYTGKITITADNVQVLLPASDLLQMQEVKEACGQFLIENLHLTNYSKIRNMAGTYSCKELLAESQRFPLQNFLQVVSTEEFLLLPFNEVEELVSNGQLNICTEEDVFNAALNWIKHDLINRSQYIAKLMVHVRLPLVNREFLMTRVDGEHLMRENSMCRELLLEAMRYHSAPEKRCALATPRTVERIPKGTEPYLFVIGGKSSSTSYHSECEVYNPRSDSWSTIAPMLSKRCGSGATGLHKLLYVVGGHDGTSDLATAECYHPLLNTWTPITPMGTKRSDFGICALDGLIYICGGHNGDYNLDSMERFDPLTGVWYSCPAMSTTRRYCRNAALENCIYAVGGPDGAPYSVERFDPRVGNWSPVPSMTSIRNNCGVAALDGHLYCIGGFYGNPLSNGERFDIRKNVWEPISALKNRRASHGVVAIDGSIYAIGGCDGPTWLNSVEIYSPKTNEWLVVSSMVVGKRFVGAAILDCIDIERLLKKMKS